jgi:tetratricopeptide (TPR) repeat protein
VDQARALYPELDNFRGAIDWLIASGDVERELRLATHAFWCLWTRSSLRELHGWLASALERAANADAYLRAEALGAAALAAANLGEAEIGRAHARESLVLARERGDKRQIEWALRVLSFDEPDLDERRRLLHECERLLRELGNDSGLGWVTYLRGMTFVEEGSYDQAREALEQAVALFRETGRRWEETNAEIAVGYVLVTAHRYSEARPLLKRALAEAVDLASPGSITDALVLLSAVRMEADVTAATRLLAGVKAIVEESGRELDPRVEGQVLETTQQSARQRLGQRFDTEWEAGTALTLEEAVELALDDD